MKDFVESCDLLQKKNAKLCDAIALQKEFNDVIEELRELRQGLNLTKKNLEKRRDLCFKEIDRRKSTSSKHSEYFGLRGQVVKYSDALTETNRKLMFFEEKLKVCNEQVTELRRWFQENMDSIKFIAALHLAFTRFLFPITIAAKSTLLLSPSRAGNALRFFSAPALAPAPTPKPSVNRDEVFAPIMEKLGM